MKQGRIYQTPDKEKTEMKKYIVEAPEPNSGQKVSSGGIRENGRLTAQFKNPVPYMEPAQSPLIIIPPTYNDFQNQGYRKNNIQKKISGIVWKELIEPLIRSGLRNLRNAITKHFESLTSTSVQNISFLSPKLKITDVNVDDEIETKKVPDKVIRFPNERAI